MSFMNAIYTKARSQRKKIVLAEGMEDRIIKAAKIAIKEELADIILLGDSREVSNKINDEDLDGYDIVDPIKSKNFTFYVNEFYELRKKKGITLNQAKEFMQNPLYFGAMMVRMGEADGMVAGAINTTTDLLKAAFQIIKNAPEYPIVSSCFIMEFQNNQYVKDGVLLFSDCAINTNPTSEQLAIIAISTAETARTIVGIEPRVAMLSFSSKGSAMHEMVNKVVDATNFAKKMSPNLLIDGEIQADAALVDFIGKVKCPDSPIAGRANILIFPDIQAGNIAYKLVERLAGARAIGPVAQGFNKPVNDLSRGCSVDDVVNMIAITAVQAQNVRSDFRYDFQYEGSCNKRL